MRFFALLAWSVLAFNGALGAEESRYFVDSGGWREMAELPEALSHHRVVAAGDALVVIGGRNRAGKTVGTVYRAALKRDGVVRKWTEGRSLPVGVSEHTAGIAAGSVYVCGGVQMRELRGSVRASDDVWGARIASNGKVSEWRRQARLPEPLHAHTQAVYGKWVYLIGGMSAGGIRQTVLRGDAESGSIRKWEPVLPLPQPLAYATAVVAGRYILVLGGQSSGTGKSLIMPTVYVGPVFEDGSISTWYLASSKLPGAWMGFGRSQANAMVHGESIFCIGGQDSLWFALENIAGATVDAERGEVGKWGVFQGPKGMPSLSALAGWEDYLYLVGGMAEGKITARVLRGKFKRAKR